jgi:transcriptional regulator with XRE-family HTH domain
MDIRVKLGSHIKELRTNLAMSQEDFAFRANLDRTYITSIERGRRNISLLNLEKIAKTLNVSLAELLTFKE